MLVKFLDVFSFRVLLNVRHDRLLSADMFKERCQNSLAGNSREFLRSVYFLALCIFVNNMLLVNLQKSKLGIASGDLGSFLSLVAAPVPEDVHRAVLRDRDPHERLHCARRWDFISRWCQCFAKFWRARSRLYRSRCLQCCSMSQALQDLRTFGPLQTQKIS